MREKGKLIVLSGPSGAGKSTVVFKAMEGRDDFCFSTSVTTRKPRPGEGDGRENFFLDREQYDRQKESPEYHLNAYRLHPRTAHHLKPVHDEKHHSRNQEFELHQRM